MSKSFYVTSPIFYPNGNLHMGHAYTMTLCDVLTRAHKLQNEEVYFLTGSDDNTGKILKIAEEKGENITEYLSNVKKGFEGLYNSLDISYDQFISTSDKNKHWPGAVELWNRLLQAGDIYKAKYTGLYCVGCEAFYTEKDAVDSKCPVHLTVLDKIEEENYFFKLSKYTNTIKEKISNDELLIVPNTRKNEILALLERGLDDVSFSRPIKNVPHGIPVPGDESQVIYVWCDALVNYISALGFGTKEDELFKKFWPASVHIVGKDIIRFHAAIWPAMLLSSGIALPKSILVHGMITSGGHKMSKSLGNVINPVELIDTYGKDAVRYYITREISPFEDGDLTMDRFKDAYNANLANGIGNLVSRIMKMASDNLVHPVAIPEFENMQEYFAFYDSFEINKAVDYVWNKIGEMDSYIQTNQPFKIIKTDKLTGEKMITDLVVQLYSIARMLNPIMPETSTKIKELIKTNKTPDKPLFIRKD